MNMMPFKEFYINCYLNNLISILISLNDSYKSFAYENNYFYYITDEMNTNMQAFSKSFKYIMVESVIEPYVELYNQLFEKKVQMIQGMDFPPLGTKEHKMSVTNDFFLRAVSLLNSGYVVFVAVNLFYYIPKSIFYNKIHKIHYSMLVSYDNGNFGVFDEGPSGYGKYVINEKIMKKAMEEVGNNTSFFSFNTNCQMPDYKPNIERLLNNAYSICNNIENIDLYTPIYQEVSGYAEGLNRIIHRQKGNILLFKKLSEEGILSNTYTDKICEKIKELHVQWGCARNRAIKEIVTCTQPHDQFIDNVRLFLEKELVIWRDFIKEIEG